MRNTPSNPNRVGQFMVSVVHDQLKIDEEWTEWHDDGFTWWAYELAQTVRYEGPHDVDGIPTYWLSYEVELLHGVPADHTYVKALIAMQNRAFNLYTAAVAEGRLVFRGRTYALPETARHRAVVLADRAMVANIIAHRQAAYIEQVLTKAIPDRAGLKVASSAHPVHGVRSEPDDMLNLIEGVHRIQGATPASPLNAPDLTSISNQLQMFGLATQVSNDKSRLVAAGDVADVPFTISVDIMAKHPQLGFGMLLILRVPYAGLLTNEAAPQAVEHLNEAEFTSIRPLISLGTWTLDSQGSESEPTIAYASFNSVVTLDPTAALVGATDALQRVRWLVDELRGAQS